MSLLDMSLAGGLIILAVTVIRAVAMGHLPKGTFLCLWAVALGRLLVPYALPSALSVYSLLERLTPAAESVQVTVARAPVLPVSTMPYVPAVAPSATGTAEAATTPINWPVVVWLAVALVCGAVFAVSYYRCRREFRSALPVDNAAAEAWLEAHPLRRRVRLRVSDRITTPLTYGVVRPVILLPKGTNWTDGEGLSYVLCHELHHIRRFDAVTKLLLAAALCLHWFNPAVWVMYVLANRDLELSCDEAVVRQLGPDRRRAYAAALIRMEERRSALAPLYNHFSKNAMEERIVAIMKIRKTSLAALLLAVTLIVGVTVAFATTAKKPTAQETVPDQIVASLDYQADAIRFTLPEVLAQPETLTVHVSGRAQHKDGFSQSLHFLEGETWEAGKTYTIPYDPSYTELFLDVSYPGTDGKLVERSVDLLSAGDAMIQFSYGPKAITSVAEIGDAVALAQSDPVSERDQKDLLAEYGHYGISFDAAGNMLYEGWVIGLFVDGVELADGGWAVRYVYQSDVGAQNLITVRSRKDNGDGSYDPFGPLTGIRAMTDQELAELGRIHESASPGLETVAVAAKDNTTEDNSVDFRDAFNEKFKPYGVSFVSSGSFGNVYWNGQLVKVFEDKTPDGGYQTISSIDGGEISLRAVYGADGKLTGVAQSTGNEALRWPLPADQTLVSYAFGTRTDPISGKTAQHDGIDVAALSDTPVYAAHGGEVVTAEFQSKYGNYVVLDRGDGVSTRYAHLSKLSVSVGDKVEAGQTIGAVGASGQATGAHLHFVLYQDGVAQDPMAYFSQN